MGRMIFIVALFSAVAMPNNDTWSCEGGGLFCNTGAAAAQNESVVNTTNTAASTSTLATTFSATSATSSATTAQTTTTATTLPTTMADTTVLPPALVYPERSIWLELTNGNDVCYGKNP
ncbi:hypothetical protein Fcan01_23678 [Folsomia candida]|uniref:Uncharacterized protein n=1 Tax=Folsomia candida TaxID=158441 RepID=A0A226D904_FOLCA|nr:hypothetical protein Fcan01_23678 [Folsomia candida]